MLSLRTNSPLPIAVLLLLPTMPLQAYSLEGLYEAVVPVTGQGEATAQRQAFRAALARVLVKVSADPAVTDVVGTLLDNAAQYVYRYEYQDDPPPGVERTTARWLRVRFRERPLLEALGRAGVATWGSERPLTLLWLASDASGTREFLPLAGKDSPAAEIRRHAERLGLPLILPLLDLIDVAEIDAGEIWLGFAGAIWEASERYAPDTVLSLCLESATGTARWTLHGDSVPIEEWRTSGDTRIVQGLEKLAMVLADRYGRGMRIEDEESIVPVRITGLADYEHYLDTLTYLESLEMVSRVEVYRLTKKGVEFHVRTFLGAAAVRQAIELGNRLQPLAGTGEGDKYWYQVR